MKTKAVNSVDLMFRAIADPTRLRLLGLLRNGERCVCDLVDILKVPQPKVSRHLAYLRRAGLVHVRKDGLWCYYRLTEPHNQFHAKLLDCLAVCCENVPVLKRDARRPTTKCC
jgi:ArsR family transcriptional regulator, arsenate/arsenite/antimonite-responsive transcriptional repressor